MLRGGRIVTLDERDAGGAGAGRAATARSSLSGSNADIAKYVGPATQVIELGGQFAMPGFIEGHGHFTSIGESKIDLELHEHEELGRDRPHGRAGGGEGEAGRSGSLAAAGTRRNGRRTPQPNVEGFPTHASLDKVSPNNPVILTHASGHASFANAKAMRAVEHHERHAEPERRRDPEGQGRQSDRPVARDGVAASFAAAPASRRRRRKKPTRAPTKALELADQEVISKGITSVPGRRFERSRSSTA